MSRPTPRVLGLLLLLVVAVACNNGEPADSTTATPAQTANASRVDLDAFRKLARESSCADVRNHLFLIDNHFVFWDRESKCADAAYAQTLYDRKPDTVLCNNMDSIAGPQRACHGDAASATMFDTILGNLDKPDLGLGSGHTVTPISF
ncbi:MAG TPA: hypothetical protein VJS69_04105 [Candidatus Krumholzibacteria bacterium]|nr:hypothetical protein [Candidatus Krumholzibacteria bacterium]